MKDNEILGNVYSKEWAMKHVLKMNDEEIEEQQEKIENEKQEAPEQGDDDEGEQFA
jgi:gas vesicle protein